MSKSTAAYPLSSAGGARRSGVRAVAAVLLTLAVCVVSASAAAAVDPPPGALDPSFGSGGGSLLQLGGGASPSSQINAVALQPDGKIVIAGFGTNGNGDHAFLVARLEPGGQLDPSFGSSGKVLVQLGTGHPPSSEADAVAVAPDGSIVVGGDTDGTGFLVVRLEPNGTFDPAFGHSGTVSLPERTTSGGDTLDPGPVTAIVLQPDGKIVTGGGASFDSCCASALVTRLGGSDGKLDASFADAGEAMVWRPSSAGRHASWAGSAVALQPGGDILLGGSGPDADYGQALVARLLSASGSFDQGFGSMGMAMYQSFPADEGRLAELNALALEPGDSIVGAGDAFGSSHPGARVLLVRLNPSDGSLDDSFGNGGALLLRLGAGVSPAAKALALVGQADGRLVFGGFATDPNGNDELLVARLSASDGSFDTTFANQGIYLHQFGTGASQAGALALQPDGKIVVAGSADSAGLVIRLTGRPRAPGGGGGPPPPVRALLSHLSVTPGVFVAAASGGSIARTTGTTVRYSDSQAAKTRFTVVRRTRGIRRGGRCLRPPRGRAGRRCTRWVAVGGFSRQDLAGLNSFHFTGRVRGHKLAPGRYRLRAVPHLAGKAGKARTTQFRIIR